MNPIDPAGPYRPRRPDVIDEEFDGEAVVVHLGSGVYYAFNGSASAIWSAMSSGRSVEETAAALGLDPARVEAFFVQLLSEDLIEPGLLDEPRDLSAEADADVGEEPALQRFTDMQDLLMLDPVHDIDLDGDGWPLLPEARA